MTETTKTEYLDLALKKMRESQHQLLNQLHKLGMAIHACTDVTGFGLLGHLGEMLKSHPNLIVEIDGRAIPAYDGVFDLLNQGNHVHRTSQSAGMEIAEQVSHSCQ